MDILELKVPEEDLEEHLGKVLAISSINKEVPHRKSKEDKSDKVQRCITASKQELSAIESRNKK